MSHPSKAAQILDTPELVRAYLRACLEDGTDKALSDGVSAVAIASGFVLNQSSLVRVFHLPDDAAVHIWLDVEETDNESGYEFILMAQAYWDNDGRLEMGRMPLTGISDETLNAALKKGERKGVAAPANMTTNEKRLVACRAFLSRINTKIALEIRESILEMKNDPEIYRTNKKDVE